MRLFTLGCILLGAWISASTMVGTTASSQNPQPGSQEVVEFLGKVMHVSIEGGFWGLISDEGAKYDPGTLPPSYREEGLRVRVKAKILRDVVTFRMWGQRVELLQIERMMERHPTQTEDFRPRD